MEGSSWKSVKKRAYLTFLASKCKLIGIPTLRVRCLGNVNMYVIMYACLSHLPFPNSHFQEFFNFDLYCSQAENSNLGW